ncbi:hypothetical protein ABZ743_13315 [Streptomyces sp. NPDC006662]|uniref:hypothetical protein n=1 Tax=Streptomyces sp. NPDC006662 TaxID=3156902 RepID=UPI0033E6706D
MKDVRDVLAGTETVVECAGLTHHHTGGAPVPFRLRRRGSDGTWVFEVGTPVAAVPALAGGAREEDVRAFARGILDTLEARSGEPDFLLLRDGCTELLATVGHGPELYLTLEATFDPAQDGEGAAPRRANRFGWSYAQLGGIPLAEPEALAEFARALLKAVGE